MTAIKCQRCSRITWNAAVCNYCGRIVCEHCIKSVKKVKRKDIGKLYICKDCWSNLEKRKLFRNGIPLIVGIPQLEKGKK